MIRVSAGIILRGDGRILACKRGEGRKNAHLWEFPGGKQEEGESPEACLRRELLEELQLQVEDIRWVMEDRAQGLCFDFLTCRACGEPVRSEHEELRWVTPREMAEMAFCPADKPVAVALALHHPGVRWAVWDLDGTLMDTYPGMVGCVLRVLEKQGFHMEASEALALMKDSLGTCLKAAAGRFQLEEEALLKAFRQEERLLPPASVKPVPGIPEVLEAMSRQGIRHLLLTHRDETAWQYLEASGLKHCFEGGVIREDGFPRKPAPDSLLHLMKKYRIPPEECIMIGDRPLDVRAGRAAGAWTCLLDPESRFPEEPCTVYVRSSREIQEWILSEDPLENESTGKLPDGGNT